jgi:hypothetical protein
LSTSPRSKQRLANLAPQGKTFFSFIEQDLFNFFDTGLLNILNMLLHSSYPRFCFHGFPLLGAQVSLLLLFCFVLVELVFLFVCFVFFKAAPVTRKLATCSV